MVIWVHGFTSLRHSHSEATGLIFAGAWWAVGHSAHYIEDQTCTRFVNLFSVGCALYSHTLYTPEYHWTPSRSGANATSNNTIFVVIMVFGRSIDSVTSGKKPSVNGERATWRDDFYCSFEGPREVNMIVFHLPLHARAICI